MTSHQNSPFCFDLFVRSFRTQPKLWLIPTTVITLLAFGFAIVKPSVWQASQALTLRDEAIGSIVKPGDFINLEERKTAQETVLELATSQTVLRGALETVGPSSLFGSEHSWPNPTDIETLQKSTTLCAPNGSEFGTTEVFYLRVKCTRKERAIALASTICDELEKHLQNLRKGKAQGTVDELRNTVELAQVDLDKVTERLARMEKDIGGDLIELRTLSQNGASENNLRRTLSEMSNELRQAMSVYGANAELLNILIQAQKYPSHLVATPSSLLASQSAISRLKDGLVDAQLRSAQFRGRMSEEHPQVQFAINAEREIRMNLHHELGLAIRGLKAEMSLDSNRVARLKHEVSSINNRLDRLVALRAPYDNLLAEVSSRSEILRRAEQTLSGAKANQAASHASLITRVDVPFTGTKPVGPGRSMIVFLGLLAGLTVGVGIAFLNVPVGDRDFAAAYQELACQPRDRVSDNHSADQSRLVRGWQIRAGAL